MIEPRIPSFAKLVAGPAVVGVAWHVCGGHYVSRQVVTKEGALHVGWQYLRADTGRWSSNLGLGGLYESYEEATAALANASA